MGIRPIRSRRTKYALDSGRIRQWNSEKCMGKSDDQSGPKDIVRCEIEKEEDENKPREQEISKRRVLVMLLRRTPCQTRVSAFALSLCDNRLVYACAHS
jgi:hypothetical protein